MNKRNELSFSIFEPKNGRAGAFQTTPTNTLNFTELINYYNSEENKKLSEAILQAPTPEVKNQLKNKRAYYTPYGTFSYRNNANILTKNNIVSIDIDGLSGKEEALKVKKQLTDHKSTLFAVISTRGEGVKAMMLINSIEAGDNHTQLKEVFKPYLKSYLNIDAKKIDEAQFKLSQPCYFSYDDDIYINRDATVLDLEFNYKAPARKPYKAVSVPKNAVNKIDRYILTVLKNKLTLLTPDGARHQKLANIKALAELNHYAPHLENEIIEAFVSAGERMYSDNEKAKIKGVRSSVTTAWNSSLNNPANNNTLDGIIIDQQSAKVQKKVLKNTTTHKLTTQYIGQDAKAMNLISNTIQDNKFTSLSAGMGMGKTTMLVQLQKMLNKKIIVSVPTIAIAEQQYNATYSDGTTEEIDKALVKGGVVGFEVEMLEECKIIYITNASLGKLKNIGDKILIVDEAHLTSDRSSINQRPNENLYKVIRETHKTLFMSGTPNDILEYGISKDFKRINILPLNKTVFQVQPLIYNSKTTKQKDAIREFASKEDDSIKFVFMDDKSVLLDTKEDLIKLGIYKKEQIVMYSANEEDVEHENYKTLMRDEVIPDGTKVVLATSKVAEGVNIKNTDKFCFLYATGKNTPEVNKFLQACRRARKASELNVFILLELGFNNRMGKIIDEEKLYKNLVDQVSAETISPALFMSNGVQKRERYSINEDFQTRSHFLIDGNNVLNPFEIAHEIKAIKESNYNFDLYKADVLAKMPEVEFLNYIFLNTAGCAEADELEKDRKQVKKDFLNKLKTIYDTPEILNLVHRQSKNDDLKGLIKSRLKGLIIKETLTTVELVLFRDKCFKQVSNWINNTIKLEKVSDTNFEDAVVIMRKEKLFSSAKFNRFYKKGVCLILKEENNPNKTKREHQLFNKYNKILNLFKGKETISKEDMAVIFRTKLHYRKRDINTSVIVNEIGFVFVVEYDRKTKIYSLKMWDKKSFYSIHNRSKVCTKQLPNNEEVNTEKNTFFPLTHQMGKNAKIDTKRTPDITTQERKVKLEEFIF